MPSQHPEAGQWERVAAELRAAKEAQQRTWGDLDNDVIGRDLANEATSAERIEVETALDKLPELKLLTELVRDVLADTTPAPLPAPEVRRTSPTVPFRRAVPFAPKSPWLSRRRLGIVLAASLLLAVGIWWVRPFWGDSNRPGELVALNNDKPQDRGGDSHGDPKNVVSNPAALFATPLDLNDDKALARADELWEVAKKHPELEEDSTTAKLLAERCAEFGDIFHNKGDLDRAERAFVKANALNRKNLGETHEITKQTCCKLAEVYQVALGPEAGPSKMLRTAPNPTEMQPKIVVAMVDKAAAVSAFRKRMSDPEARKQVREDVLPVLVKALKDSTTAADRERWATALGNLGPIADDAAPALIERFQQAKEKPERFAIIRALVHLGPNPAAKKQLEVVAETGSPEEQTYLRELIQRSRGGK